MTWLISTALSNSLLAALMALAAFAVGRWLRRPAVTHVLWILVLVKLVTPPIVPVQLPIPLGWTLPIAADEPIVAAATDAPLVAPIAEPVALPTLAPTAMALPREPASGGNSMPSRPAKMQPTRAPIEAPVQAADAVAARDVAATGVVSSARPVARGLSVSNWATLKWASLTRFATTALLVRGLAAIWLIGSIGILAIVIRRVVRFSRLLAGRMPAPAELREEMLELSHAMGLARWPNLELISGPISPMLWWLGGESRILFPSELIGSLSAAERKTLLVHELAHYARGDHWIRLLEVVTGIIYWWNPVAWFARRQLHLAEEACCDAWVVAELPESRPIYARALVHTIGFLSDRAERLPIGASGLGYFKVVEDRVRSIMTGRASRGLSGLAKVGLAVVALLLLPLLPRLHGEDSPRSTASDANSSAPTVRAADQTANADATASAAAPGTAAPVADPKEFETASRALVGGRGGVRSVAVSPDGKLVVSSTGDFNQPGELTVWDVVQRAKRLSIPQTLGYRTIAFTPDGSKIFAGNFDGRLTVINSATAQWFNVQGIHRRGIMSVDLSRDGTLLVTGSYDNTVKVWKVAKLPQEKPAAGKPVDAALIRTFAGGPHPVFSVSLSPDKTLIAAASQDRTIRLWDVQTGGIHRTIAAPQSSGGGVIEVVTFSPDGKTLAAAYGDGMVRLWKVADGETAGEFTHLDRRQMGFDNRAVSGLVFTQDGKTLISAGFDGQIKLWSTAQAELLGAIPAHEDQITGLLLTKDDRQIVSCSRDGRVKFWDIDSRQEVSQLGDDDTGRDQPEPIVAAAWSPDGRWVASAHEDRTVRIREAAEGKVVAIINGHDDVVAGVAFAPNSQLLATASYDRTVKLWDLSPLAAIRSDPPAAGARGAKEIKLPLLQTCRGHGNWVMAAAFSPDGKWLLTGSYDRTARLWLVETGQQAAQMSGHTAAVRSVAFAPDGHWLATGSSDRTARLWSVEPKPESSSGLVVVDRATFGEHSGAVRAVAFSPDGQTLATGSEDKSIKLWNLAATSNSASSSSATGEGAPKPKPRATLNGHEQMVFCLAFSPRGRTLVSGGLDNTLRVWDPISGKQRQVIKGHTDAITSLMFTPNSSAVLSASLDRSLRLWPGRSMGLPPLAALNLGDNVRFVGITPDSRALIAGTYNAQLKLWDLSTGKVTEGHQPRALTCGALARDGRFLATGGLNGDVYLWTVQPLAIAATLKKSTVQIQSLAFSPDSKQLAAGDYDGNTTIWSVESRKVEHELPKQELSVEGLDFSPDGTLLASATGKYKEWQRQGTVKLWNPATGQEIVSLPGPKRKMRQALFTNNGKTLVASGSQTDVLVYDVALRALKQQFDTGTENSSLALLPDNKTVAIGGLDGSVRLWSLETGLKLQEYEGHREGKSAFIFSAARSTDGSVVATAGADNYLRLIDTAAAGVASGDVSGRLATRVARLNFPSATPSEERFEAVKLKQVPAHGKQLWFIVYSPDGKQFATGGFDQTIKLWNAETFEPVTTLAGHTSDVMHAAFSPDGRLLASVSFDKTVRLWDIAETRQIAVLDGHQDKLRNVAFSPSGKWVASAGEDGTVRIWDVGNHSMVRVLNVGASVSSVVFLGSDKRLAVGTGNHRVRQVGDLSLWDAETGQMIEKVPDSTGIVGHLQSLDNGDSLLAANAGAGVAIRNVTTGLVERAFRAPIDVRWCEMSRDRRFVLATYGLEPFNVSVWRRETGAELISFPVADVMLFAAAFSPDGRYILAGTADSTLTVWELKQTSQTTTVTAKK